MRSFYSCFIVVLSVVSLEASSMLEFVGNFSNMNYSEDHQYGEDVYLWRNGEDLYGYMEYSLGGALGDVTMARLEKIRFEPKTGKLSFETRNPLYDGEGNVIRNLFVFNGKIQPDMVEGILGCRSAGGGGPCNSDKKITWKKLNKEIKITNELQLIDKDAWEEFVADELQRRGARW